MLFFLSGKSTLNRTFCWHFKQCHKICQKQTSTLLNKPEPVTQNEKSCIECRKRNKLSFNITNSNLMRQCFTLQSIHTASLIYILPSTHTLICVYVHRHNWHWLVSAEHTLACVNFFPVIYWSRELLHAVISNRPLCQTFNREQLGFCSSLFWTLFWTSLKKKEKKKR